ncbi:uncharacterized protein K452DRAFT_299324 [Aplosporella prunicola CBS 121167]|uniref:EKC/KEOPS complex subunit BUD32 n=1 Tax=Aplosporella prunicola CBS 121167 TaxID=1176127 RepID=A0A6A6BCE1_9PEZI|nr:uncharacterized protein K452DRAFT_299324 [Aplosporella prunicola CBS 121167]KAF2140587.1 hypothetical protein K452DRAFT_299324 [Aplosporella prunicola CBS 121167]
MTTTTTTTTTETPHHTLPGIFASSTPAPELLTQGAEALVYKTGFLHANGSDKEPMAAALKFRPAKPYRHPVLDRRLTRQRVLAEARVLVRLRREGVAVPAVLACDWEAGWLLLEWIQGQTIRACLDQYLHAMHAPAAEHAPHADGEERHTAGDEAALRAAAPELWALMTRVGRAVGRMHSVGCVHGDLTTSNLMLRPPQAAASASSSEALAGAVIIIDFGLAAQTVQDEDKAVDLYVLERAFGSTHPAAAPLFGEVLSAYGASYSGAKVVLKRLEDVRLRGRKRSMLG